MVMVVCWQSYKEIPKLFYINSPLIYLKNMEEEDNPKIVSQTSGEKKDLFILRWSLRLLPKLSSQMTDQM